MKKLLKLSIALSMIIAMSVPVWATTTNIDGTKTQQDVIVSYNVNQGYTITIPAELPLAVGEHKASEVVVSAADVRLASDETLNVTMKSKEFDTTDKFRIKYDTNEPSFIKYEILKGDASGSVTTPIETNDTTILTVTSGTTEKSTYLKFYTTEEYIEEATKSGSHQDTLTFSCGVTKN